MGIHGEESARPPAWRCRHANPRLKCIKTHELEVYEVTEEVVDIHLMLPVEFQIIYMVGADVTHCAVTSLLTWRPKKLADSVFTPRSQNLWRMDVVFPSIRWYMTYSIITPLSALIYCFLYGVFASGFENSCKQTIIWRITTSGHGWAPLGKP